MSISVEEIAREFIRYGSKRLRIEDRLDRFIEYIKKRGTKCAEIDVVSHYVDNLFIPILENMNQLVVAVDNNSVPRYWRNRFTRALNTRDKGFIRWFFKNYVQTYADVDAIVSGNNTLLPCIFNYCFSICPAWGSSCVSGPSAMCFTGSDIGYIHVCCPTQFLTNGAGNFDLVDDPPWISTYSSGLFTPTGQPSGQSGVLTLTGNITTPSCFPSGGVNLGLDFGVNYGSASGNCASSCPQNTSCPPGSAYQCGSSQTYGEAFYPVLYYTLNYTFLPNSAYTVWWSASVS